jgi:hypothetical protein
MATNFVRGTCFFQDMTSFVPAGWSESHWLRTPDLDLQAAIPILQTYALKRQQLLAPGIAITYLRVSNDNVFRDSQVLPGIPPMVQGNNVLATPQSGSQNAQSSGTSGGANIPLNPLFVGYEPDMTWTAVLMRGEGGAPYTARSMFWVAGIADNLTFHSYRGIIDPTWLGLFATWAAELTTNWGFLGQDNSNANPPKQITNVIPAPPGGLVSVTAPAHGFVSGAVVAIRGVKTIQNLGKAVNATWQIIVVDANTFQLAGSVNITALQYASGGTARLKSKVLIPYSKILQRRFGSRKRGRPFGLLSGRRRPVHKLLTQPV